MPELNLQLVDWSDRWRHPRVCRYVRRQQVAKNDPIGGKNLALIEYTSNWEDGRAVIIASSFPQENKHSERKLFEGLANVLDAPNKRVRIRAIYTERAPCGVGPGMANCYGFLRDKLAEYQYQRELGQGRAWAPLGLATPVYYSYTYPSSGRDEIRQIARDLAEYGIRDDPNSPCIPLSEFFQELGKEDRDWITFRMKAFERDVRAGRE